VARDKVINFPPAVPLRQIARIGSFASANDCYRSERMAHKGCNFFARVEIATGTEISTAVQFKARAEPEIPTPSVAVVLIADEETNKILTVFNRRWASFTLPMTKQKKWMDPAVSSGRRVEKLEITATRAAAEVLGKAFPSTALPVPLLKELDCRQSDADGVWKIYALHIFGLKVPAGTTFAPCVAGQWLVPAEFRVHEPISSTARYVIECLGREGKLP